MGIYRFFNLTLALGRISTDFRRIILKEIWREIRLRRNGEEIRVSKIELALQAFGVILLVFGLIVILRSTLIYNPNDFVSIGFLSEVAKGIAVQLVGLGIVIAGKK